MMKALPSRGGLVLWQLLVTVISSLVALIVISTGYSSATSIPSLDSLLLGTGLVEACRLFLSVVLYYVHKAENLATM